MPYPLLALAFELSGRALLVSLVGLLLAEAALEPGHAAAGVEDLLLARIERVAAGADVGVDDTVLRRAAGDEGLPAAAGHRGHHVVRVNTIAHFDSWFWRPCRVAAGSCRAARA